MKHLAALLYLVACGWFIWIATGAEPATNKPVLFTGKIVAPELILETNRAVRFYDDRTNLVLTVIHTNGTWIAIKP